MTSIFDQTLRQIFSRQKNIGTIENIRYRPGQVMSDAVFVLSTGRAGTKTLAALGSLDAQLYARHEPQPLLFALSKSAYANLHVNKNLDIFKSAYWTARIDLFYAALQNKKRYFETSPQSTFLGPVIADLLPKSKFIHLTRHPLAVIRSGMRRKWYSGNLLDSTRIEPLADSPFYGVWQSWSPFEKNIWLWRETNQWIQQFLSDLPPHRHQLIQAEKIFDNYPTTMSSLFDFLGVPTPADHKIKKILSRSMNAQASGAFPLPDKWSQSMLASAKDILGDSAQDLGYYF